MTRLALAALALALSFAAEAASQSLTWAEGAAATAVTVRSVVESNPAGVPGTVLANIEILPIEITGRTLQQELDATRSRRITRNGLTRVELPRGGRVFAYKRSAGQAYGYLLIQASGDATVLLERPGIGGASPFGDRIGVSPDGAWGVAVAHDGSALHVLRLDGATFGSTGTPARSVTLPAPAEGTSIMPGRTHVFVASDDERMRRCAMADGGQLEDISPPPIAGARIKSELAMSGDGRKVVYLYGVQPSFSLYIAGETGVSTRLPAPQAKYEEPGYLPETPNGPRMLLNFDGTRLMYTDATIRDEIYLLDTTGATVTTHVTGDHNFEPYIGIGIFPVFAASVLVIGVGDPDRFDVYGASSGETPVVNLTRTGNTTPPYFPGSLIPQVVTATAAGSVLVADRPLGGALRLLRTDPGTGNRLVVADQLDRLPALADATRTLPDVLVSSLTGDHVLEGVGAATLLATPPGVDVHTDVLLSSGWRILTVAAGNQSAIVFRAANGALVALPMVGAPQRATVTSSENLLIDGGSLVHVSPSRGAVTVGAGGTVRFVLSGLGV